MGLLNKKEADDIVTNDIIPIKQESVTTFGRVKTGYSTYLHNTSASYPDANIDLAFTNIKAAHRYLTKQPNPDIICGLAKRPGRRQTNSH